MTEWYKVLTEEESDKIELLYEKGYSITQISDKLVFSESVIISLLTHRGILD